VDVEDVFDELDRAAARTLYSTPYDKMDPFIRFSDTLQRTCGRRGQARPGPGRRGQSALTLSLRGRPGPHGTAVLSAVVRRAVCRRPRRHPGAAGGATHALVGSPQSAPPRSRRSHGGGRRRPRGGASARSGRPRRRPRRPPRRRPRPPRASGSELSAPVAQRHQRFLDSDAQRGRAASRHSQCPERRTLLKRTNAIH
jgi:hypothetical protein